uniref:NR LBD domain-containing protein n=1 Tax=Meloidogyne hapla TaxID=6305 RepID=A0A1I8BL41_MELHA
MQNEYALNILESHYSNLLNNQSTNILKKKLQITIISHMFMLTNFKKNSNNLEEEKTGKQINQEITMIIFIQLFGYARTVMLTQEYSFFFQDI